MARTHPRLAAGRARVLGLATRGTTAPNRLRRVDRYLLHRARRQLHDGLVVDLGFGASPVTTVEMFQRIRAAGLSARVVGLELDPARVAAAVEYASEPELRFTRGGFELAGLRPTVVRALNVLRQYDVDAATRAWDTMVGLIAPEGLVVEGTCDERGRVGSWVTLDSSGPLALTISLRLTGLATPTIVAERLPKALIHGNVSGQPVHEFVRALGSAWETAAPLSVYGPVQRFIATAQQLRRVGWPLLDTAKRWRLGELTVAWSAVSPPG